MLGRESRKGPIARFCHERCAFFHRHFFIFSRRIEKGYRHQEYPNDRHGGTSGSADTVQSVVPTAVGQFDGNNNFLVRIAAGRMSSRPLGGHHFVSGFCGDVALPRLTMWNPDRLTGNCFFTLGPDSLHCSLQAIAMIHVLLANEVVTEAATLPSPSTQPAEANVSGSQSARSKALAASSKRRPRSFLRTCLVLVPKNVLRNWQEELEKV